MQNRSLGIFLSLLFFSGALPAQQPTPYHITYDDSTLQQQGPFTLMPFNRLVQSAGKVVTYGDSLSENHALDFTILPDSQHIVVEDRYGIAVLDVRTQQIVHRWTFRTDGEPSVKSLMSTIQG